MKRNRLLALCMLAVSLTASAADPIQSPYVGAELNAEGGTYFLYQVESGLWLQNNNRIVDDWNTRGQLDVVGFDFEIVPLAEGGYKLNPKFGHNQSLNASNFYLDTQDAVTSWTLTPVDNVQGGHAYTITSGDVKLSCNDAGILAGDGSKTTWQLVTREERIAKMAEATEDNPVDVTWLIQDYCFANENERATAWQWTREGGNLDNVRWYRNRRSYAVWNCGNFVLSQTINDVPNGIYKLNVKAFYRDGNRDDVAARRKAGTERLLGKYFINSDKADVMSILDGASSTWIDGLFYFPGANDDAPYGHYPDNADSFNRIFQEYPQNYMNQGLISKVTGKMLRIGLEKTEANANDWLAWDEFYLTYLGPIALDDYIAGLNNAIAEAEAFDPTKTSIVLKNELTQAIAAAKAALTSTDAEVIGQATADLYVALEKARSVDVTLLRETMTVTENGVNMQQAMLAITNAQSADEVNEALFKLRTERKMHAQRMNDMFIGSQPAEGEFFLFNVGRGLWLNNGSDWNTHCALSIYPLPINLVAAEDGKFKMQTHMFAGKEEKWINWNAYVDTGDQHTWTFNPVQGKHNVYTINSEGDRTDVGRLLGYDPFGPTDRGSYWYWDNVTKDREGVDNPDNQWKLVTRAEIEALMENATEEQPVDVSFLIDNGGLSRVWGIDMWTRQADGGNGGAHITSGDDGNFNRNCDYGFEYWNTNSFAFSQTISGLKPGFYQVCVNGFYRQGDGNFQAGVINSDGTLISEAYLKANDEVEFLPNITTEMGKMPGIFSQNSNLGFFPNWPAEALHAFQTGLYPVSVKVMIEEGKDLTIGVYQDQKTTDASWTLFDSFRLIYQGPLVDTGIQQMAQPAAQQQNSIFNLNGQRVLNPAKGLYIKDGRKVMVK